MFAAPSDWKPGCVGPRRPELPDSQRTISQVFYFWRGVRSTVILRRRLLFSEADLGKKILGKTSHKILSPRMRPGRNSSRTSTHSSLVSKMLLSAFHPFQTSCFSWFAYRMPSSIPCSLGGDRLETLKNFQVGLIPATLIFQTLRRVQRSTGLRRTTAIRSGLLEDFKIRRFRIADRQDKFSQRD